MSAVQLVGCQSSVKPMIRVLGVESPYRNIKLPEHFVAGRVVEVDAMDALLLDIEEADCVGGYFEKGAFTEGTIDLEPWLVELV